MTSAAPLASLIFGLTIVLVISRPRRLTEAAAALVGAAVMIVATGTSCSSSWA
jgi:Na+/H+ antiporter NhaD/arsenite permease-like protein